MLKGVDFTGNTLQHITVSGGVNLQIRAPLTASGCRVGGILGIEIAEVNEKNN